MSTYKIPFSMTSQIPTQNALGNTTIFRTEYRRTLSLAVCLYRRQNVVNVLKSTSVTHCTHLALSPNRAGSWVVLQQHQPPGSLFGAGGGTG